MTTNYIHLYLAKESDYSLVLEPLSASVSMRNAPFRQLRLKRSVTDEWALGEPVQKSSVAKLTVIWGKCETTPCSQTKIHVHE